MILKLTIDEFVTKSIIILNGIEYAKDYALSFTISNGLQI